MKRKVFAALSLFLSALLVISYVITSKAEKDPCSEKGIVVKNLNLKHLWYKRDSGDCFFWKKYKIFVIRSEEKIDIFSDLVCKTLYCDENPDYEKYLSFDSDGDCRVKILPGCNLSDM